MSTSVNTAQCLECKARCVIYTFFCRHFSEWETTSFWQQVCNTTMMKQNSNKSLKKKTVDYAPLRPPSFFPLFILYTVLFSFLSFILWFFLSFIHSFIFIAPLQEPTQKCSQTRLKKKDLRDVQKYVPATKSTGQVVSHYKSFNIFLRHCLNHII